MQNHGFIVHIDINKCQKVVYYYILIHEQLINKYNTYGTQGFKLGRQGHGYSEFLRCSAPCAKFRSHVTCDKATFCGTCRRCDGILHVAVVRDQ